MKLAGDTLREAGHPASPDTTRRIMTTLEALATYGQHAGAPPAGRLTDDVDPPGFEALAALVPERVVRLRRARGSARHPLQSAKARAREAQAVVTPREDARPRRGRTARKEAEARKALQQAERALADARRAAERARAEMKAAAARAKAADKAKAAVESRFEKLSAAAEAARQAARRVAGQAEEAAQAVDDAERAVKSAREQLKD